MAKGKPGSFGLFPVTDEWEEKPAGTVGRGSPVDELLDQIKTNESAHRQTIGLIQYDGITQARSMHHSLMQRIGPVDASGFVFSVRSNGAKYAVTAKYDPTQVTDEGKVRFMREKAARKQAEKAKADAKKAKDEAAAKAKADAAEAEQKAAQGAQDQEKVQQGASDVTQAQVPVGVA